MGPKALASVSPKQPPSLKKRDWYPYYAGFNEAFVHAVVATHLNDATKILDPWSGSGTTTAACIKRGLSSTGIDINPALTVIARARLLPLVSPVALTRRATEILSAAAGTPSEVHPKDLLSDWIQPSALCRIRAIQIAIHRTLLSSQQEPRLPSTVGTIDNLPDETCFYYSALFIVVRNLLSRFRSSNPMWLKLPRSQRHRICPTWTTISARFAAAVRYLGDRLSPRRENMPNAWRELRTGTATDLPFFDLEFDGILTSPPYATRLDYVMGTIPELAVLGADQEFISKLRRQMTGTPVVRHSTTADTDLLSKCGTQILECIATHPSKGSRTYYLPWLRNYFIDLQGGLLEIDRTVAKQGKICLVVQDSYYKEKRIDLQRIVTEMLQSQGRTRQFRYDYTVRNPRSYLRQSYIGNNAALEQCAQESLLVFV